MFLSKSFFLGLLFFTTAAFSHHGEAHSESGSGNVGLWLIMLSVLFSTVSVWLEAFLLGRKDQKRAGEKARDAIVAKLYTQADRAGGKYVF